MPLYHALGSFDVLGFPVFHQHLHYEGLEQLQSHRLGQTALVQLQLRTNHDNGTTGIIHALAQQVLAETPLLALEHVGQGLQGTVARTRHRPAAPTVVEQRVHSLLQHTFLVVDDDVRGFQFLQTIQTIVAVNDAAVQVIQVRSCETSAIQLHHRAQIRGNDRNRIQDHRRSRLAGLEEGVNDLQTLQSAGLLLTRLALHDLFQRLGLSYQVKRLQTVLHCLGAHAALEVGPVQGIHFAIHQLVAFQVADL